MVETFIVSMVVGAILGFVETIWKKWKYKKTIPEELVVPMSKTDEKMIEQSQQIIKEFFGDNIYETIGDMKNIERIQAMADFADCLVKQYGLDTDVDIYVDEENNCGQYSKKDNKATFNISMLIKADKTDEYFKYCVNTTMDTILHELRHAVQYKAIDEEGFWNVDEATRNQWAKNYDNYISPGVDFKGYSEQPVEADAITFAALVMEGVA